MKNTHEMEGILKQMNSLSDKDKVAYLFGIIDQENDKPSDQIDFEKIEECSRLIGKLMENELPELTAERIEDIRKKNDARIKVARNPVPRKCKHTKRIYGIAAAIAILLCAATISISAYAEGMSIGEYIVYVAKNLLPGESIEHNGITFIRKGKPVVYKNMEELIENEILDIYYPTELPSDVYIKKILLTGDLSKSEKSELIFVFSDPSISFSVCNYQAVNIEYEHFNSFDTDVGTFYIISKEGVYQAVCQTETYEYTLTTNDETILKIILKGLKKS